MDHEGTTLRPAAEEGSKRPGAAPGRQIGLVHFGIPLGIAGLAGAWTAAETAVGATEWVADILWDICLVLWLGFGILYVARRLRSPQRFGADLHHPVLGPFAAYIPLIGVLMTTHFGRYLGDAAEPIVWALVACSIVVAAQLFAHWLIGGLSVDDLHPGYFLPVVAAAFVCSIGLSGVHARSGGEAAFGAGLFFWLVIGTIVTGRLITRAQLPDQVKPTLAVLVVPPALGGIAWLFLDGGRADPVGYGLLGILVALLIVQLVLIGQYRRLAPSISFWTFVFPIAASTNFALRWLTAVPFAGSTVLSWTLLGVASAAVVGVTALTLPPRAARVS